MKFFEDPKKCMWLCRILPFFCITIFIFFSFILSKRITVSVIAPLMLIVFFIYGSFITYYLPALLFEGNYRLRHIKLFGVVLIFLGTDPAWYLFFAAATLGLGPIYWYWIKVDPVLKEMSRAGHKTY